MSGRRRLVDNVPMHANAAALQFAAGALPVPIPLSMIGAPPTCDLLIDPIFFGGPMNLSPPTADIGISIQSSATLGTTIEVQAFVVDMSRASSYPVPVLVSDRGTFTVGTTTVSDSCMGAYPILDGLTSGDNLGTTTGPEITGSCGAMGSDVWYLYPASCTGTATVSFCQGGASASYDTVLAAFSGTCGALTQLACNDDSCSLQSEITFPVTAGNIYYIAVGGYSGAQGTFTVFVGCQ